MTSASYSSQAKFTRSISKSGRWVSRCPRDRALHLQFKARILRDREQPGRFGVLLGSLTTTRPIVPQNYSPARIRFIPAARINPIFCYQCYLRDRYGPCGGGWFVGDIVDLVYFSPASPRIVVSAERSSMPVKAQIGSRPCALNFNLPKGLRGRRP